MQVEGAKQENGTNIQQWGTTGDSIHDIWKLVDAGSGYFYIISQIGDGILIILIQPEIVKKMVQMLKFMNLMEKIAKNL